METFCLKEKKKTKCIEQSGTKATNSIQLNPILYSHYTRYLHKCT